MSCSAQLSESIFISLILGVHVEDEKGRMILPSSKELPRMTQLPDRIVNLGNESAKFSRSVAFPSQHELYMTNVPSVCFFSCLERHRSVLFTFSSTQCTPCLSRRMPSAGLGGKIGRE
ncbi:hypothetical protein M0657_010186 [Pyricularia oryzae]|nr:hypothetical protein M9X92_010506 [Pyricularia oryzae]KAI7913032.1 hypothetical protein M0657_010186 [Pyricularia oryzae]